MNETGIIVGLSVSHERASVDQIEAVDLAEERSAVARLADHPDVAEAFVLLTCNRAEAYVVADNRETGRTVLEPLVEHVPSEAIRWLDHEESLRHLLRVAAGLESLVVGEDQILGQVRDAYHTAREGDTLGRLLDTALTTAVHVGERARTETAINEGVVSLGSAAVELAGEHRNLSDASALVVGAGEMGSLAAAALADAAASVTVTNRSIERAERVAADVCGSAIALDALPAAVADADVVVSATGSREPVLDVSSLADAGETFVVDIAQPRDVSAAARELPHLTVRDLDALEAVTAATRADREAAAETVETIVEEALEHLLARYKRNRADQVIAAMYEGADRVKHAELRTAMTQLEAAETDAERREVLESLADALVSQLLAAPTTSLREAAEHDDWETIHTALRLFDPSMEAVTDVTNAEADLQAALAEHLSDGD